jgi:hypothetical protein
MGLIVLDTDVRLGDGDGVGHDHDPGAAARAATTSERHLDRGLL